MEIKRYPDGTYRRGDAWIPDDPANVDRQEIAAMLAAVPPAAEIVDVDADGEPIEGGG